MPFVQALELLRQRHVFLSGGSAFVPHGRLVSLVVARFRAYLSKCLAFAFKALPSVLRDERLGPLLGNMAKAYMGPEYGGAARKVRATAEREGGKGHQGCTQARAMAHLPATVTVACRGQCG